MKTTIGLFIITFCLFGSIGNISAQETEQRFSLYFENDKDVLTQNHFKVIDSIKGAHNKEELDVHIKGYTNNIGNEYYNLKLSKRRAANVTKMLREFTIISSQGYGEIDSDAARNRRVDIFVHHKDEHLAEPNELVIPPISSLPKLEPIALKSDLKKGDRITIEGIMFFQDRDVILEESRPILENLFDFLEANPEVNFKLIGHICCGDISNPGRDLINLRTKQRNLSEARAKAVYNYLRKNGIDNKRMRYLGMAFIRPLGGADQDDRRVEIEITSID
jgi:outer membrane protein OmpA-like peptidoglycan-associated protein